MAVHVSEGNRKIGITGNISLPPVITCVPGVPCAVRDCYAKLCFQYPTPREQWTENLDTWKQDPLYYFSEIAYACNKRGYEFFRWHVGGDIPNQEYLGGMKFVAELAPNTLFMAYTKRYELNYRDRPKNLVIIMSCWPGYRLPENSLPRFWVQDNTDRRVPASAFQCPGECETCRKCWHLKTGESVVIQKHGRYAPDPGQGVLPLDY
jgi:hypothetical protein